MVAVFRNDRPICVVDRDWLPRLVAEARTEPLRRSRLCLHMSEDDSVQEMLIAFWEGTIVPPHRHIGKSESFHLVAGELDVVLLGDDGSVVDRIAMRPAEAGGPFLYRLATPLWHTVILRSEWAVIHEVATGPFTRDVEEPPAWYPRDPDGVRAFMGRLAQG